MGEEEEIQMPSSSNSIGLIRSSKKLQKQKKVPQRGLGVAQLEKIRLQDQQITKHQFNLQNGPLDPSLMNIQSRSSSSSLLNLPMELPSNQNNPYLWPQEQKMVGMKRSYPFGMGLPSIEEPLSFAINGPSNFRCCDSTKQNWKKVKKENWDFNGDFLTLAPPPTDSNFHSESFDFSSLPYQGRIEDEIEGEAGGASLRKELETFYSFIPSSVSQTSSDFCENVIDLNLKL